MLYVIALVVVFLICVFITRYIFKIESITKNQKAIVFLLFKIAKKDMEESEQKQFFDLLGGELSEEYLKGKSQKKEDSDIPDFLVTERK